MNGKVNLVPLHNSAGERMDELIYWKSIHHSAPAGTVVVVVVAGVLNAIIFSNQIEDTYIQFRWYCSRY